VNRNKAGRVHPEFTGNLLILLLLCLKTQACHYAEPHLLSIANRKGYTLAIAHCTALLHTKGDPQVAHEFPA
jgi:hypothetical protein